MKILYLHQYFVDPSMPGGTRSFEMARRWVSAGHEVHVVTMSSSGVGAGWSHERIDGIDVHRTPIAYSNSMGVRERLQAFLRYVVRAARRASEIGGDVVFATSTPLTVALPGAWARFRLRAPMVFEVRDLWPEVPIAMGVLRNPIATGMARALERFAYRNASRIVALSPGMAEGVVAAGYPRDRIAVVPNGCDADLFDAGGGAAEQFLDRRPHLRGGPIVLYAGALGRANGVAYLVRVAEAVKGIEPKVRFVILGEGAEENSIREAARQRGLLERERVAISETSEA